MPAFVSSTRSESSEVARHIARVAARLFAERGYDATSVREIVEAAGVAKPTLYYHFGSKEGLAQALVTVPLSELLETSRKLVEDVADPVAMLEQVFEAHFRFCRDDPDRARFVYALLFGPLGSGLAAELARLAGELLVMMGDAVRRLVNEGHVGPERSGDCVVACRGLIVISTMDFLYRGSDLDASLAPRLVNDLLRGLGVAHGSGEGVGA